MDEKRRADDGYGKTERKIESRFLTKGQKASSQGRVVPVDDGRFNMCGLSDC